MKRLILFLAFAAAALAQPVGNNICNLSGSATNGYVLTSTGGKGCSWQVGGGGGGGTGAAASAITYTPSASVTLTCPSSSAGTVTIASPSGGAALAANMAISFAGCTTNQIIVLRAQASGQRRAVHHLFGTADRCAADQPVPVDHHGVHLLSGQRDNYELRQRRGGQRPGSNHGIGCTRNRAAFELRIHLRGLNAAYLDV